MAPAPERVRARSGEPVVIAGDLRAHDGTALREATVVVERTGWEEPSPTLALDDEGGFRVEVPPGVYRITIDAPDHRAASRTTVVTTDFRVEGRLRASARVEAGGAEPPPPLQWIGENPTTTAMLDFHARWYRVANDLHERIPRTENGAWDLTEQLRAEGRGHAARARAEVDAVTDPTTRALLLAVHVELFTIYCFTRADAPALREDLAWIFDHASPADLHWALPNLFLNGMFVGLAERGADAAFLTKVEAWYERRAREHPVPSVAVAALAQLRFDAEQRGDQARVAELDALGRDDHFARAGPPPPRVSRPPRQSTLERGKPLPPFDFAALGDPGQRITSADRGGRLFLIDVWSTVCGPCVDDMPALHAAYAAINGAQPGPGEGDAALRGLEPVASPRLEFVLVSVDDTEAEVETFRRESWSMPWTHAFVGHTGMRELWALWGVRSIPTTVLVDETGTILEMGESLRGDRILPTLERVLAERGPAAKR
jgi:thiol-disulfide isomerase/thioredoxin